jgi:hypothetical protein
MVINVAIADETQLKGLLKINDWGELKGYNVLKYIKLLPNLEKDMHFKVLGQMPKMADEFGSVVKLIKSSINESEKLSSETKEAYGEIVRTLEEMLKKDNLSMEEHDQIFDELVKIASFINTASQRDEEFLGKVVDDIFKTAAAAILIFGLFFGAKSILASLI